MEWDLDLDQRSPHSYQCIQWNLRDHSNAKGKSAHPRGKSLWEVKDTRMLRQNTGRAN